MSFEPAKFFSFCLIVPIKGNVTIPPTEGIFCQETIQANQKNSNDDNEDPVFDLFPTEIFYPSIELFEEIVAFSKVVGDDDSTFGDADQGATLF